MEQVRRLLHRHEPEERTDRGESGITAPGAVAAFVFDMDEEVANKRDVHLLDVQLGWRFAGLFAGELEQAAGTCRDKLAIVFGLASI